VTKVEAEEICEVAKAGTMSQAITMAGDKPGHHVSKYFYF
jgi:hypothetical protein